MSGRTPGPWTITTDPRHHMPQIVKTGSDGTPYVLAKVCGGIGTGAREANAAFIVAACNTYSELVAALRDMLTLAPKLHYVDNQDGCEIDAIVRDARAALAKVQP